MSLTKVTYAMIQGGPASVLDFIPAGVNPATTDVTTYIQNVLDNYDYVIFPEGHYSVSSLNFNRDGQQVDFQDAYLIGNATTATTAIAVFTAIQSRYNNFKIFQVSPPYASAVYNANYTAAMQITALSSSNYAGRCTWTQLGIYQAKIGVLYGKTASPVDAPVSENNIIGGEFRDVERCFFVKQPNGFCFVTNMVVDCQNYGGIPAFNYTTSAACEMEDGWMQFTNCSFVKGQSALGFLFVCAGNVYKGTTVLTGCQAEAACTNFYGGDDGRYYIDGFRNNLFNNATSAFIEFKSNSIGVFNATNLFYTRGVGGEAVTKGLINSYSLAQWEVSFVNGVFENQNMQAILDSDNHYTTQCSVRFKNCITKDVTYGVVRIDTSAYTAVPALLNLPVGGVGAVPPIAQYQTVTSGGSTILVQTDAGPTFNQCIVMTAGTSGNNQLLAYPSAGANWPYDTKSDVLEWCQKVTAGANGFNGSIIVYYYDSGTLLGTSTLQSGTVGNIAVGNTAAVGWVKNQIILPDTNPKATTYGVEFRQAANSQQWKIGGIRVY
jgi:hypothetical protein